MELKKNAHYMMPVSAGPVPGQPLAKYRDVTMTSALYVTDKDALAALLPKPFEAADDPIVTVYHFQAKDVDFIAAGGGYNIFGVNLNVVYKGDKETLAGNYALVLWENNHIPIVLGREMLGVPKLYAQIPDIARDGNDWWGCVVDNNFVLGTISVRHAALASAETIQMIEGIMNGTPWMTWKFIPSGDALGADVSRAMLVPATFTVDWAYTGVPEVKLFQSTYERCQTSANIMAALSTLKVKEYRAGAVTHGAQDLLTGKARPLG
jgi:acetoacetate decarboxylase